MPKRKLSDARTGVSKRPVKSAKRGQDIALSVPKLAKLVAENENEENDMMALTVGMIIDPNDFDVVRMRDTYSVANTVVAKPKLNQKINWWPMAQPVGALPDTDFGLFIFRDPLRAAITYTSLAHGSGAAVAFTYDAIFSLATNSQTTTLPVAAASQIQPALLIPDANSAVAPHGPYLPCGQGGVGSQRIGFWVDKPVGAGQSAQVQINVTPTQGAWVNTGSPVSSVTTNAYRWAGGNWEQPIARTDQTPANGNAALAINVAIPQSGYWAFEIDPTKVVTTGGIQTLSTNLNMTCTVNTCWAHSPMGDIFPYNVNQINGIRTLAVGCLFRNEASPLNQQGNITVMQASKDEDWFNSYAILNGSFYDKVFTTAEEEDFLLAKGAYAYLKPTSESDLSFNDDIQHGNTSSGFGGASAMYFPLNNNSDYLIFAASTSNTQGGDAVIKIRWAVEYKTQNNWLERSPPLIDPTAFSDGIEAVAGTGSVDSIFN